jgi:hypothetical protein
MIRSGIAALFAVYLALGAQAQTHSPSTPKKVEQRARLLAIAKNWESQAGNVGAWPVAAAPKVPVEFLAMLSESGHWSDPTALCTEGHGSECDLFLRNYVNYTTNYTVITEPGWGSKVAVSPVRKIGDCYEFPSEGLPNSYQFGETAVASDAPDLFVESPVIETASPREIKIVRSGLLRLGPARVKTIDGVSIHKFQLQGNDFFLAEHHYSSERSESWIVFSIGRINQRRFEVLRWNPEGGEDGDTVESALGIIRLKTGQEFLLTTQSDPEGHTYYAYGIKNGRLEIVFKGGGSSC